MEVKSFVGGVKSVENRTVKGIAAVFGNVDSVGDRMINGAFRKSLKNGVGRVKHLWMHDLMAPPTAKILRLEEVSREELPGSIKDRFPDATGGLLVERKYLDTPRGNEILEGIRSGAITEMSFAFNPVKFDFEGESKKQIRNLREVILWDTSDVNFGANEATVAAKYFGQLGGWSSYRGNSFDSRTLRQETLELRSRVANAELWMRLEEYEHNPAYIPARIEAMEFELLKMQLRSIGIDWPGA